MWYIDFEDHGTQEYDNIEDWGAQIDYFSEVCDADVEVEGNYAHIFNYNEVEFVDTNSIRY